LWGLPLLIEGEPGTAKTARVKQIAKAMNAPFEVLYAAQHPPEDFSGALIPDGKGNARSICPLPQIRSLIEKDCGVLFLDEINGAPPATQGALMSLIHERRAGDDIIPPRVRILAAQNPADLATGGFAMSAPLANRFLHITDPGPDAREWAAWLIGASKTSVQLPFDVVEKTVIDEWPTYYPETIALFSGFMERNPALIHKRPDLSSPDISKAWPSQRTWDFAARALTTSNVMERSDTVRDALVECAVGEGAATALLTYMRTTDIPKPMDVLDGKWKLNPDRLDIVLAAYTGAIAYVRQRPDRKEQMQLAPKAWKCLMALYEAQLQDIVVPAAEGLIRERLGHNSNDETIKKAANPILVPLSKSGLFKAIQERIDQDRN
jgi:hypothetical protein